MTADTTTIREALERQIAYQRREIEMGVAEWEWKPVLAALGRVEEREREMDRALEDAREANMTDACDQCLAAADAATALAEKYGEALRFYAEEAIWDEHGAAFRFGDGLPDRGRIARAALAGSVARKQEQDLGRASAASTSRERLTEGRAEE